MREQTYGWYPPAKGIWYRGKEPSSYYKESLYKHWGSRYNNQSGVATPKPPTPLRRSPSPHIIKQSRSQSRCSNIRSPEPPSFEGLTISGTRAPSVGSLRKTTPKPNKKPAKAWAPMLPATEVSIPMYSPLDCLNAVNAEAKNFDQISITSQEIPHNNLIRLDHRPSTGKIIGNEHMSSLEHQRTPTATGRQSLHSQMQSIISGKKSGRTQSATVHRERTRGPIRPARSAGSVRSDVLQINHPEVKEEKSEVKSEESIPDVEQCPTLSRPGAPLPESEGEEEEEEKESEVESLAEEGPLNYEEQLEKFGWRFEIPGDPYNLKKPCLPERLPYTVKLAVPKIPPNPPTGHMMNYETYFYNTIPRKPATFTIHQEWASEVLHAKRMEFQKKAGVNHTYKQYAFIY